jgi:hypothetical protein
MTTATSGADGRRSAGSRSDSGRRAVARTVTHMPLSDERLRQGVVTLRVRAAGDDAIRGLIERACCCVCFVRSMNVTGTTANALAGRLKRLHFNFAGSGGGGGRARPSMTGWSGRTARSLTGRLGLDWAQCSEAQWSPACLWTTVNRWNSYESTTDGMERRTPMGFDGRCSRESGRQELAAVAFERTNCST